MPLPARLHPLLIEAVGLLYERGQAREAAQARGAAWGSWPIVDAHAIASTLRSRHPLRAWHTLQAVVKDLEMYSPHDRASWLELDFKPSEAWTALRYDHELSPQEREPCALKLCRALQFLMHGPGAMIAPMNVSLYAEEIRRYDRGLARMEATKAELPALFKAVALAWPETSGLKDLPIEAAASALYLAAAERVSKSNPRPAEVST